MSRFLQDADYQVLIRTEIKNILLENYSDTKLFGAEKMAMSQIKNYLRGRYDVEAIYRPVTEPAEDTRDAYIVMITIDCALYHLYSSLAPNKIPAHRSERYQDALEWLKMTAKGEAGADLPPITDPETGEVKAEVRITSKYKPNNNRW
jgi:hypothetical protein